MTAQQAIRWMLIAVAMVVFTLGGFAAARLTGSSRSADGEPAAGTPTAARTTIAQLTATAQVTGTAQGATATVQAPTTVPPGPPTTVPPGPGPAPKDPTTVPPGPGPAPKDPTTAPPPAPLVPVQVFYAVQDPAESMEGICGYQIRPFTYQVREDPIISAVEFLRSEMGFGGSINFLYGLPLSIGNFAGDGGHVDIYLKAELPYVDNCTDLLMEYQLRSTLGAFDGLSTGIYINGTEIGEFFSRRWVEPAPDPAPEPEPDPELTGSISGILGYPADGNPALEVMAIDVSSPGIVYIVNTVEGQNSFSFDAIPAGQYYIVARIPGTGEILLGGFTNASLCGLNPECGDRALVPVDIGPGHAYGGVAITDWGLDPAGVPPLP